MELVVSASEVKRHGVLEWMIDHMLEGHVVDQASVRVIPGGSAWVEPGCIVHIHTVISPDEFRPMWESLSTRYAIQCGHLTVGSYFTGCVLDYLGDGCPRLSEQSNNSKNH